MGTAAAHPNCCSFWSERIALAEAREAHLPYSATTPALEAQEARAHRSLAPAQCMMDIVTRPSRIEVGKGCPLYFHPFSPKGQTRRQGYEPGTARQTDHVEHNSIYHMLGKEAC